jgi:hypothetical protein
MLSVTLEGVAGLMGRFNPETMALHGEAAEIQNMNVQAGCWLWPCRPGPGESAVDDDPIPVADGEGAESWASDMSVACFGRPGR